MDRHAEVMSHDEFENKYVIASLYKGITYFIRYLIPHFVKEISVDYLERLRLLFQRYFSIQNLEKPIRLYGGSFKKLRTI
eukprot:UN20726